MRAPGYFALVINIDIKLAVDYRCYALLGVRAPLVCLTWALVNIIGIGLLCVSPTKER